MKFWTHCVRKFPKPPRTSSCFVDWNPWHSQPPIFPSETKVNQSIESFKNCSKLELPTYRIGTGMQHLVQSVQHFWRQLGKERTDESIGDGVFAGQLTKVLGHIVQAVQASNCWNWFSSFAKNGPLRCWPLYKIYGIRICIVKVMLTYSLDNGTAGVHPMVSFFTFRLIAFIAQVALRQRCGSEKHSTFL
jgi:hypothetical protein